MIFVKVIQLGEEIKEYVLEDGSTVNDLARVADKDLSRLTVCINHYPVSTDTVLSNNAKVCFTQPMKGNTMFEVKVFRLGGNDAAINLPAEDGYTITQLLNQLPEDRRSSYFNSDGSDYYSYQVIRDGVSSGQVTGSFAMSAPATDSPIRLLLSQRMKGNR